MAATHRQIVGFLESFSAQDLEDAKRQVGELAEFIRNYPPSSVIPMYFGPILDDLKVEVMKRSTSRATDWRLKLKYPDLSVVVLASIKPDTALAILRDLAEKSSEEPCCVKSIVIVRLNQRIDCFDDTTIANAGIFNNDVLCLELTTYSQREQTWHTSAMTVQKNDGNSTMPDKTLEALSKLSSITIASPIEILCMGLHCFLLDEGFVSIIEVPSTVPGFAAAIKGKIENDV